MKQGKCQQSFVNRRHWSHQTPSSNNTRDNSTHGHHQMSTLKSDWLYSLPPKMEKLYTVSKNKTGSWLCLDHELLIAKFRLQLKKVGKTTRPFRYDLYQIPYDYTVEVTNRLKRLDLTECRGLWHCTGGSDQDHPWEKECKKSKWLSGEALQISEKKR